MRKTKIICTLGPAVDDENAIKDLILKGMNGARFNFSHGDHASHKALLDLFKKVRDGLGMPVAAILDTKGPEIRTGTFVEKEVKLIKGSKVTLTTDDAPGDASRFGISYKLLYHDVKPGDRILIDDGLIETQVVAINGTEIECIVINDGVISSNKGINVPDVEINLPSITDKDIDDLRFGVENDFDFVAASFIRKADDVNEIRKYLKEFGGEKMLIISKIENRQGVENIDEIIEASDAIMVARGDLGIEIPVHEVPILQKIMIKKCFLAGKPVITATQMLDSMIRNPRPTRAEASDVANAVYDGTDCVMLSGETASGKYPNESVDTMVSIVEAAEADIDYWNRFRTESETDSEVGIAAKTVTNAISRACCDTAMDLGIKAIVTMSESGNTARMVSRYRPQSQILAVTTSAKTQRQLSLSWGVASCMAERFDTTDEMFDLGAKKSVEAGIAKPGELVVITAGVPIGVVGSTNLLKVQMV